MTAALIAHGYASLRELQTFYSYEDALDMHEVLTVRNYNEWVVQEDAKRK